MFHRVESGSQVLTQQSKWPTIGLDHLPIIGLYQLPFIGLYQWSTTGLDLRPERWPVAEINSLFTYKQQYNYLVWQYLLDLYSLIKQSPTMNVTTLLGI